MKRERCPKCDNYIIFDETRYEDGQQLVFQCEECGKQFAIRMGKSTLHKTRKEVREETGDEAADMAFGSIHVIENSFHYKQILPLRMGDNIIGKYAKGNDIQCPIESCDPSLDLHHCKINVSRDKKGRIKYTLSDGPSNTGTFVDNTILGDRERRVIHDGTLFTLGATSVLLYTGDDDE